MKITKLLLITILLVNHLCADSPYDNLPERVKESFDNAVGLMNIDNDPSAIVGGVVNIITGDFVDLDTDLEVPGAMPLVISRSYTSARYRSKGQDREPLLCVWRLNHRGELSFGEGWESSGGLNVQTAYITYGEGYGVTSLYDGSPTDVTLSLSEKMVQSGLTNTGSGEISGRTNRRNSRAAINLGAGKADREGRINLSDGTVRHFQRNKDDNGDVRYLIDREQKANGNYTLYEYDLHHRLEKVKIKNKKSATISSVKLHYPNSSSFENRPRISLESSNGRKVHYGFIKKGDFYFLSDVKRPHKPDVHYTYDKTSKEKYYRIVGKKVDGVSEIGIDYYHNGLNKVQDKKIKADWRLNRVKRLQEPVGVNGEMCTTRTFVYSGLISSESKDCNASYEAKTYDALGRQTTYVWSSMTSRLESIIRHKGEAPYVTDRLFWDDTCGQLVSRVIYDKGVPLVCRHYKYDARGNIVRKQLSGVITGTNFLPLRISPTGERIHNSSDKYSEHFSYNEDNLLIQECRKGGEVRYRYLPNSDLLEAKFICNKVGSTKIRYFYAYNDNGTVVEEIVDDGTGDSKDDLTSVTMRKITRKKCRQMFPVGLPNEISEYYLECGEERLLSRKLYTYDESGHVIAEAIYDSDNRHAYTIQRTFDNYGNMLSETDPLGYEMRYTYNASGNKTSETRMADGFQTDYVYDRANRLVSTVKKSPEGVCLREDNYYDLAGQRVRSKNSYREAFYSYDDLGRLASTNIAGNKTVFVSDAMGRPVKVTDALGFKVKVAYNIYDKPISILHPDGSSEQFVYSLDGDLVRYTSLSGAITTMTYDYQKRLLSKVTESSDGVRMTESHTYDAFHQLSETDTNGVTTYYRYDGAGRVIETERLGVIISYLYDALGRKVQTTEQTGSYTVIRTDSYDLLNRLTGTVVEDESGILEVTAFAYDGMGNKIQEHRQMGDETAVWQYQYDSFGALIATVDPLGNQTKKLIDYLWIDEMGNTMRRECDLLPDGTTVETIFDGAGRVVKKMTKDMVGTLWRAEEITYDAIGHPIILTETSTVSGNHPETFTTRRSYDWKGRIIEKIDGFGTPLQHRVMLRYRADGQRACLMKADGVQVFYDCDSFGNLVRQTASDGSVDYRYTYDDAGRLIRVDNQVTDAIATRTYDEVGRLTSETLENGLTVAYEYDVKDRITRLILPDAGSIAYAHDATRLTAVVRLDPAGQELYRHTYDRYDQRGLVLEETSLIGTLQSSYDLLGRPTQFHAPHFSESDLSYDPCSRLVAKTVDDTLQEYTYDAMGQILSEPRAVYLWDSRYNCVQRNGEQFKNNVLNRVTEVNGEACLYDANGNLTAFQGIHYAYDALDRLTTVTTPDGEFTYAYDSFNRRINKKGPDLSQNYLYMGDRDIGMADSDGTIRQLRVLGQGRGADIGASVAIELDDLLYAPLHDRSGNIVRLIEPNTDTIHTASYTAFGTDETPFLSPWGFSSKRQDPETGLINFGRRYYSPTLMRWITPDPIDRAGGPNIYAYAQNNPLTTIDLYGFTGTNSSHAMSRTRYNYHSHGSFNRLVKNVGEFIYTLGRDCIPIPGVREALMATGHAISDGCLRPHSYDETGYAFNRLIGYVTNYVRLLEFGSGVSEQSAYDQATRLQQEAGGAEVYYGWAGTRGFVIDALECFLMNFTSNLRSVHQTYGRIKHLLDTQDGDILIDGHSLAMKRIKCAMDFLTPEERQRIHIKGYGGAEIIDREYAKEVTNYVSTRDVIPALASPIQYTLALFGKNPNITFVQSNGPYFVDHFFAGNTYGSITKDNMSNILGNRK